MAFEKKKLLLSKQYFITKPTKEKRTLPKKVIKWRQSTPQTFQQQKQQRGYYPEISLCCDR